MEQQLAWVVKDLGPDRWPVTEMATVTNVNATAYFLIPEHNEDRARPNFQAGLCCKNVTGVERRGAAAHSGGGRVAAVAARSLPNQRRYSSLFFLYLAAAKTKGNFTILG